MDEQEEPYAIELGRLSKYREDLSKHEKKTIKDYYESQNDLIERLENVFYAFHPSYEGFRHLNQVDTDDEEKGRDEDMDNHDVLEARHRISVLENLGVSVSFLSNVTLFIIKLIVTLMTGSMVIFASAIDSFMDIASGFVLYFTMRFMRKLDLYKFPQGKSRVEPVGIIIFACLMGVASLQIFGQSVWIIVEGIQGKIRYLEIDQLLITLMIVVIVWKVALFLGCSLLLRWIGQYHENIKHNGSNGSGGISNSEFHSVLEIYVQDHFNDTFFNTLSVLSLYVAATFPSAWFVDPLMASILALYILWNWAETGLEQIHFLIGKSADPEFLTILTAIAKYHSPHILQVDTVRAYHFGPRLLAEIDIVLPEDMPLRQAHDIGEALQNRVEELEEIERAFVHLDWEWEHDPEHKKVWLQHGHELKQESKEKLGNSSSKQEEERKFGMFSTSPERASQELSQRRDFMEEEMTI